MYNKKSGLVNRAFSVVLALLMVISILPITAFASTSVNVDSFTVCVNDIPDRIKKFESELGAEFKMITDNDLELITIRHYNEDILKDMKKNKLILFEERLSDTVQMVVRNLPKMKRKETNH